MFGGDLFLTIFLLINVFVVGVVATIAVMHARAHMKPTEARPAAQRNLPILPLIRVVVFLTKPRKITKKFFVKTPRSYRRILSLPQKN